MFILIDKLSETNFLYFFIFYILINISHSQNEVQKPSAEMYLIRYGYMKLPEKVNISSFGRSMALDPTQVRTAITTFQKRNRLNVTGIMDATTRKKLASPRCGVSDVHGRSMFGQWPKNKLKYKYIGRLTTDLPENTVRQAIRDAFAYWENETPLRFLEVFDKETADINIEFLRWDHGDGYPFDGRDGTLAHAFFPTDGRLHFDDDETFTEGENRGYNLRIVAAHEIGHALGLPHSYDPDALMAAYYAGYVPKEKALLNIDDVTNIQAIYGKSPIESTTTKSISDESTPQFTIPITSTTEIETSTTEKPTTTIEETTTEEATTTTEPTTTTESTTTTEEQRTTTEPTTTTEEPTTTTEEPTTTIQPIPTEEPTTTEELPTLPWTLPPQWPKPKPRPMEPDLCSSSTVLSAALMGGDGYMYLIIKHKDAQLLYQSELSSSLVPDRWPLKFHQYFKKEVPSINAALFVMSTRTYYFFSGTKMYLYTQFGYYSSEEEIGKEVIGAFNMLDEKSIAVTKDNMAWKFNARTLAFESPQPLSNLLSGVPSDIDAAAEDYPWSQDIRYVFFFKGRKYYKFDLVKNRMAKSEGDLGDAFFGCSQYTVPKRK